jgi:hypothetical protein
MTRPSTSHELTEFEISEIINEEVLDHDILRQCGLDEDSNFENECTQLVTPRTTQLAKLTA